MDSRSGLSCTEYELFDQFHPHPSTLKDVSLNAGFDDYAQVEDEYECYVVADDFYFVLQIAADYHKRGHCCCFDSASPSVDVVQALLPDVPSALFQSAAAFAVLAELREGKGH